ncbi:MAG: hypothetical protein QM755_13285 [Luteolibacter sp.]
MTESLVDRPHVPEPARRKFVRVWTVCWMIVVGALVPLFLVKQELAGLLVVFVLVASLVLVLTQFMAEKYLRRMHLPFEGRRPWCSFSCLAVLGTMAVILIALIGYRQNLPGFASSVGDGTLSAAYDGLAQTRPVIGFEERGISRGSRPLFFHPGSIGIYAPVSLRFHPVDRPNLPGWSILRGEKVMRLEGSDRVLNWDGRGLRQVIGEAGALQKGFVDEAGIQFELQDICTRWSAGRPLDTMKYSPSMPVHMHLTRSGIPPVWLMPVLCGVTILLLGIALHVTSKATMGGSQE